MGVHKKEKNRRARVLKDDGAGNKFGNIKVKGENFYHDAKKARRMKMYTQDASVLQSKEIPTARIDPNRRWFNNSRVISQDALLYFRDAVKTAQLSTYNVILKRNKLPMSLLEEKTALEKEGLSSKALVQLESFSGTFGPKSTRKKQPKSHTSFNELIEASNEAVSKYDDTKALSTTLGLMNTTDTDGWTQAAKDAIFHKGQSKRIWNELYKVIDSSDVVIQVLDARDPLGTRCEKIEQHMKVEAPHKHMIFVLNKCDLVPTWVAAAWVKHLSKEYPTLAFHASIKNSFGKGSLIQLLRQFKKLKSDKPQISVGFIGYPNVGKSSVINTLKAKKVANVAPIPGETKVWQYVALLKSIFLIDCPGVVPPSKTDLDADILFRGAVRVENVSNPEQYVDLILEKVKQNYLERTYEILGWKDSVEFLELIAKKSGRLLKGGEPDLTAVAKQVINDFNRGKIPWFVPPPEKESEKESSDKSKEPAKKETKDTSEEKEQEEKGTEWSGFKD